VNDPASVTRLDGGLYRAGDDAQLVEAQPGEDGAGLLVQGAIERSNVALTDEMVRLMMVQRAYGANAQILQAADQLMGIANGLRR
jgi:flagellar basal-body rod protein FlgG